MYGNTTLTAEQKTVLGGETVTHPHPAGQTAGPSALSPQQGRGNNSALDIEGVEFIAVVGESEVGKSTLARELGRLLGWKVGETADVIGEDAARLLTKLTRYSHLNRELMLAEMAENKPGFRAFKLELGNILCGERAGFLVEQCLEAGARIVVGMRRPEEFAAMMERCQGKRLLLIVVEKAGAGRSQLNVECRILAKCRGKFQIDVTNSGAAGELEADAKALADVIRGRVA